MWGKCLQGQPSTRPRPKLFVTRMPDSRSLCGSQLFVSCILKRCLKYFRQISHVALATNASLWFKFKTMHLTWRLYAHYLGTSVKKWTRMDLSRAQNSAKWMFGANAVPLVRITQREGWTELRRSSVMTTRVKMILCSDGLNKTLSQCRRFFLWFIRFEFHAA